MKRQAAALSAAALLVPLSACGGSAEAGSGSTVTVTVGYQSRTINTVTAGTLLRSLGYFEKRLNSLHDGHTYKVDWQDYATGAPITAQMTAGKIDIGSMGDFPLLLNAARGTQLGRPTRLVSVTGYNLRGGLNTVVTAPGSKLTALKDLKGKKVSTSIGSAADGTLVRLCGVPASTGQGHIQAQPAARRGCFGALRRQCGRPVPVRRMARPSHVPGEGESLYDGAQLNLPTFHGVTAREDFTDQHPAVLGAFLEAQAQATDYLNRHPVTAAEKVAEETDLPAEVVYLYNGAHGIATFDPAVKPQLVSALKQDVSVLKAAKLTGDIDVDSFVDDQYVKKALGSSYARRLAASPAPAASEAWAKGSEKTVPSRIRSSFCVRGRPPERSARRLRPRRHHRYPLVRRQGGLGDRRRPAAALRRPRHRAGLCVRPWRGPHDLLRRGRGAGVMTRRPLARYVLRAASLATALGLWQVLTSLDIDLWLRFSQFPTVTDVAHALAGRLSGADYWTDLTDSLTRILTGFALAAVLGVATGVLVARSPLAEDLLGPVLEVVRPIPAIALVPVAILLFPSNEQGIVFITCTAAFFPVLVSTRHAVRALTRCGRRRYAPWAAAGCASSAPSCSRERCPGSSAGSPSASACRGSA